MSVLKRFNGTSWEIIGPQITSTRFDDINHMIAPEYSSTDVYNIGDYVVQSDKLYQCISTITVPEEWTEIHWNQVSINEEIIESQNSINKIKSLINPKYPDTTITGQIISIDNSLNNNYINSLIINTSYEQSGTGTASINNIRPIIGYSEINTYVSSSPQIDEATIYTTNLSHIDKIYGSNIDIINGKITILRETHVLTGDEAWRLYNNTRRFILTIDDALSYGWHKWKVTDGIENVSAAVSSHGRYVTGSTLNTDSCNFRLYQDTIALYDPKNTFADLNTFKQYLKDQYINGTPLQISYLIEKPITYTINKTNIQLLTGINYIQSNNRNITLNYTTNSSLNNIRYEYPTNWARALINSSSGRINRSWTNDRALLQSPIPDNVIEIEILNNVTGLLIAYSYDEYIGEWTGTEFLPEFHSFIKCNMVELRNKYPNYYFYILVQTSVNEAPNCVKYTIDTTIKLSDNSITTESPYSAMGKVAESYFNVAYSQDDLFKYSNDFGLYCESPTNTENIKTINCSQFVYALLTGTYYNNSRYIRDENVPSIWGWQSDGTGSDGNGTGYKPQHYIYDDFMYSQFMSGYFQQKGVLIEYKPNHRNIQKGDICFVGRRGEYPQRINNVGHVAIVFNIIDENTFSTLDGGGSPRMTRIVDDKKATIGIATWGFDETESEEKGGQPLRFFFARNPLPPITIKHKLITDMYAFQRNYSIGAGEAYVVGVCGDLKQGMYTALIEYEHKNDMLIEPRINVYYDYEEEIINPETGETTTQKKYDVFRTQQANGNVLIPFYVEVNNGIACITIKNNHETPEPVTINRIRVYDGLIGYIE